MVQNATAKCSKTWAKNSKNSQKQPVFSQKLSKNAKKSRFLQILPKSTYLGPF